MAKPPTSTQSGQPEPDATDSAFGVEDDLLLVIEPLEPAPGQQRRGFELRPLLNVASLALLLVLVLAGGFAALRLRSGGSRSTGTRHVQALIPASIAGWNPGGPTAAQDIVFAPSAPGTAYACGVPALSSSLAPVPVVVSTSRDTGRTWRTLRSPGEGVTCSLTVNPTNALDVLVMLSPSSTFASKPIALYRTFDGGSTWSRWPIPPRLTAQTGDAEYAMWAWAGSTLLIAPYYPGTAGYTDLAASIGGQPFFWVQRNGLFHGAPPDASINALFGADGEIYAVLLAQSDCAVSCTRVLSSGDGGISWALHTPTFQGQSVNLLSQSADGRTLFGGYFDNPTQAAGKYVYSSDGGATWRQLTPLPLGSIASDIFSTPDGTCYAVLDTNPGAQLGTITPGVYRLAPGARGWTFVAPPIGSGGGPVVVSWDAAGHPVALWGNLYASIADGSPTGLQRHAA